MLSNALIRYAACYREVYWSDQDSDSPTYGINMFSIDKAENTRLIDDKLGAVAVTGISYDWVSGW